MNEIINKSEFSTEQWIKNLLKMGQGGYDIALYEIMHGFDYDSEEGQNLLAGLQAISKTLEILPRAIKQLKEEYKGELKL